MAEKRSRTLSRQARDRWRNKIWYNITAPDMFNRANLGETITDEPEKLIGRRTIVSFQDLTGDYGKSHVKLTFQIHEVKGSDALARFIGHDFRKDYVIRLARRRRTKIDAVFDVKTKDGYTLRIKPLAIADRRIKTAQEKGVREAIGSVILEQASSLTFSEFVKAMLSGEIADMALKNCRLIIPLKKLEIKKSEVLAFPAVVERIVDEVDEEVEEGEEDIDGEAVPEEEPEPTPEEIGSREDIIELFTALKGIGPMKAEALYDAGFDTMDKLRDADSAALAEVEGFSPALAKKVIEQL